jgi:DNA-binding transcriptional MerR regulator
LRSLRWKLKSNLKLCGPHNLRYTFSTWLEDAGIPARVIDELMGHADGDNKLDERLEAEQRELERWNSKQARWRQQFALDMQRLESELGIEVGRQFTAVEADYRAFQSSTGTELTALMDALPEDLERSLNATWMSLVGFLQEQLDQVLAAPCWSGQQPPRDRRLRRRAGCLLDGGADGSGAWA